jgi:hypothetical protein
MPETTARVPLLALFLLFVTCITAQASPVQNGFFNAQDGTRLHYLEAGRLTDAPSLVLIPGWTLSATLWPAK